jgi:hypothetical protein
MSRKPLPQENSFHEALQNSGSDKEAQSIYSIKLLIFIVMDFQTLAKITIDIKQRNCCTRSLDQIKDIVSGYVATMRQTENTTSAAPSLTTTLIIFCCYYYYQ